MFKNRWNALLSAIVAVATFAASASAQVTTGSIVGRVVDGTGAPLADVQVVARNLGTGQTRNAATAADGRYAVIGLDVGDGWSVTARRIGFAPQTKSDLTVSVGTSSRADFTLAAQAAQLSSVKIVAATDPIISASKTGVGTTITDSSLHRLPTLNRNFTDFLAATPQVSNSGPGLSGGGANNRYNNIQIDGSTEKDLFGLGSTGQPGGQAGGKSIGIESVKQYQVLLSPFDVRYGNFAGAIINAVTKSGTNKWSGSTYYYYRDSAMTRTQSYLAGFRQSQYGLTLGGPIIKDKVFFFVNPEFQDQNNPASGPYTGGPAAAALPSSADIDRFRSILSPLGINAGTGALRTNKNPLQNIFIRLDFQGLPFNSTLTVRENYAHADQDNFSRSFTGTTFPLTDNGYTFKSDKSAWVAQLKSAFSNGGYNELYAGLTHIRDARVTFVPNTTPQIQARGTGSVSIIAGAERSSQANQLDQDVYEFTDNYSFAAASNHRVTIGTQNQWYKVRNLFGQQRYGSWTFNSLDSLANGLPSAYSIGVPAQAGTDGAVRFKQRTNSVYIQDEWTPSARLTINAGLRADASFFEDRPPLNQGVLDTLGRRTDQLPSGNWQIAPRIGFNWDITGDGRNQLRGGWGIFTGQPAFVWMANQYQNSGLTGYAQLSCNNTTANTNAKPPAFNAGAIANPPTQCATNNALPGLTAAAGSEVNLASKNLKFPQSSRFSLGYDHEFLRDYVFTLEGIYTLGINQLYYQNIALAGPQGTDRLGRVMYGPAPTTPVRIGSTINAAAGTVSGGYSRDRVFEITNSSKDWAYQLTTGLTHRYSSNFEASLFYTYSQVRDVQSLTSSTTISQYQFGKSYGDKAQSVQDLGHSVFEQPHRIVAAGTYTFQPTGTDISLTYIGESGQRFHYTYGGSNSGDMNGDGIGNDLLYVPKNVRDSSEIIFATLTGFTLQQQQDAFDKFITDNKCINRQRGTFMKRNSCEEPFRHTVNLSVRQRIGSLFGGVWKGAKSSQLDRIQLQWDVFNLANLINRNWGILPQSSFGSINLLQYSSKEAGSMIGPNGARARFTFSPTTAFTTVTNVSSNYRMQMAVRYSF
jgi:outer membrane receptor for ferrienterochelin and colicin